MTIGTVVAVVLGRHFLEHQAHVALVVLNGVPSFSGKGSEFSEGMHLAGFGGHGGEVERRQSDGKVLARELGNFTGNFIAKGCPELTEKINPPNIHVGGR